MKIVQVHNRYRLAGGTDRVADQTVALLRGRGQDVTYFSRDSGDIGGSPAAKARAFAASVYSRSAAKEMAAIIEDEKPDVVHAHNIYPLLSPSIFATCRRAGVPTVMTVHTYWLTCPTYYHLRGGEVCERCAGGHEFWCVTKNCRGSRFESLAYAVRTDVARRFHLIRDNVTVLVPLCEFVADRLCAAGFNRDRMVVLPNMSAVSPNPVNPAAGTYVGYSGRLSPEKGVDSLLEAARLAPEVPVRIAGDGPQMAELREKAPENVHFDGWLSGGDLKDFYRNSRFMVIPSTCFEICAMVALEAMGIGVPIIASDMGGNPELVEDGKTGYLYEAGNAKALAEKMSALWQDPAACARMGEATRARAVQEFSEDVHYTRLMGVYERAIAQVGRE